MTSTRDWALYGVAVYLGLLLGGTTAQTPLDTVPRLDPTPPTAVDDGARPQPADSPGPPTYPRLGSLDRSS